MGNVVVSGSVWALGKKSITSSFIVVVAAVIMCGFSACGCSVDKAATPASSIAMSVCERVVVFGHIRDQRELFLMTATAGVDYKEGELRLICLDRPVEDLYSFCDETGFALLRVSRWAEEGRNGFYKEALVEYPRDMDMREAIGVAESSDLVACALPEMLYSLDD